MQATKRLLTLLQFYFKKVFMLVGKFQDYFCFFCVWRDTCRLEVYCCHCHGLQAETNTSGTTVPDSIKWRTFNERNSILTERFDE